MSGQDDAERVRDVLGLIVGIFDDRMLAELEHGLAASPSTTGDVPMPGDVHPAVAGHAAFVRQFDGPVVRLPLIRKVQYDADAIYPQERSMNVTVMTKRRAYGLAPYVGRFPGDEARYVWSFWVDDMGRHIGGDDAELRWMP